MGVFNRGGRVDDGGLRASSAERFRLFAGGGLSDIGILGDTRLVEGAVEDAFLAGAAVGLRSNVRAAYLRH